MRPWKSHWLTGVKQTLIVAIKSFQNYKVGVKLTQ